MKNIINKKNISAIILAAGEGKRMKSKTSKVLCELLFEPMISWVSRSLQKLGCSNSEICIVCPDDNDSKDLIVLATNNKFCYATQKQRLGTAHAVKQAIDFIKNSKNDNILIMLGDAPLVSENILKDFYDYHLSENNSLTILSSEIKNPFGYGRILRDPNNSKNILKIVEELDCNQDQKLISEINSGVMCFKKQALLIALDKINNNNIKNEYYITSAVDILKAENQKIGAYNCQDEKVVLGANTRFELLKMNEIARLEVIKNLAENGIEFISTEGVVISPSVKIGAGSVIYPGVILKDFCEIGENCVITSNSFISKSSIGSGSIIKSSYIDNSKIGENVKIGPFSNIRPNCDIKSGVKIGDFVEIKNSNIDQNTSVAHLTYIGDSDVGQKVNFGCGCVTVNYNGLEKHRTIIGNDCFIGCNTNLIAPVKLGDGVYTAAGSTITDDIPDGAMSIARSRQINKTNWKLKK
ncbi:MAG: bifunctional UDP-N-acetylglucosamine diphosphorylase/glucosamine-1-phosphate N-acetyltransferase GlmU [Oscillospiraceae bacterium]|nr:bifunctional UDP-N-acetylglucosamine diphosphorylase/glucosamine-1-phosphate N-acetyltransferase GlmU [Oscillospiraceae bacterium]